MAFRKGEKVTHVAYNYGSTPRTVTFSDGATLVVEARAMGIDGGVVVPPVPSEPTTPVVSVTSPAAGSTVKVGEAVTLQRRPRLRARQSPLLTSLSTAHSLARQRRRPYAVQWTPTEEGVRVITRVPQQPTESRRCQPASMSMRKRRRQAEAMKANVR